MPRTFLYLPVLTVVRTWVVVLETGDRCFIPAGALLICITQLVHVRVLYEKCRATSNTLP